MTREGGTPDRSRRGRTAGAVVCAAALFACGGPEIALDARPSDAQLFVDGRRVPIPLRAPVPYHGVIDVTAVPPPPPPRQPGDLDRAPLASLRGSVAVPEPVTPWIFPLDFFVEVLTAPFTGDPVYAAMPILPPRQDVPDTGEAVLAVEEVAERARRAAAAR